LPHNGTHRLSALGTKPQAHSLHSLDRHHANTPAPLGSPHAAACAIPSHSHVGGLASGSRTAAALHRNCKELLLHVHDQRAPAPIRRHLPVRSSDAGTLLFLLLPLRLRRSQPARQTDSFILVLVEWDCCLLIPMWGLARQVFRGARRATFSLCPASVPLQQCCVQLLCLDAPLFLYRRALKHDLRHSRETCRAAPPAPKQPLGKVMCRFLTLVPMQMGTGAHGGHQAKRGSWSYCRRELMRRAFQAAAVGEENIRT
jgi:hypothetical protein